ncbi:hypothetical protein [Marinicella litoralis]|nr:hypothetical protein [Marinicella litoralis]
MAGKINCTFAILVFLTSCAVIPLPKNEPVLVVGIPITMDDTNWYRDYCSYGQPMNDKKVPYGESCNNSILVHAYMHSVKIKYPKNENGTLFETPLIVALTGGKRVDFTFDNQNQWQFILQPSPKDFAEDTGIKYMATSISYNEDNGCVTDFSYMHTDYRKCPDRSFHKRNKGNCLSIETLKEHYNEH